MHHIKYFGILFLTILSINSKGQNFYLNHIFNPFEYWSFGTAIGDYNDTVYIQGDGGQTIDYRNFFLATLDSSGQVSYDKKIQRPQTAFYSSRKGLIKTSTGFFTSGTKINLNDTLGYIYKFGNNFKIIDSLDLTFNNFQVSLFSLVKTLDNCLAVCGHLSSSQTGNAGIILYKIDSSLNLLWSRTYQDAVVSYSFNLINTSDNGFLISGMKSNGVMFTVDPLVIKTDSYGIEQWSWNDGSPVYDDGPVATSVDYNGGYFLSYAHGIYQSAQWPPLPSIKKVRLVKLDEDGQEVWSKFFGIENIYNWVNNMLTTESNDCLINYHTNLGNCGMAVLLKTTSDGDSTWLRYYIYNDSIGSLNEIMHVCESNKAGYLTIGENFEPSIPGTQQSVWIMHLDSLGCQTPECNPFVGTKDLSINSINCYPNPTSKFVTFKIPPDHQGATLKKIKASVFTNNGSFIESYSCNYSREVTIDISHLASGIYYISFFNNTVLIGTAKVLKL